VAEKEALRPQNGPVLIPLSDMRFVPAAGGRTYEFDAKGGLRVVADNGTAETYERVQPARPTPEQLHAFVGTYASDEAEVAMQVIVDGKDLKLTRRPDTNLVLTPLYEDAFSAPTLGLVRFRRRANGQIVGFSVVLDRVWDLRFERRRTGPSAM
jgi:hypothetical protein